MLTDRNIPLSLMYNTHFFYRKFYSKVMGGLLYRGTNFYLVLGGLFCNLQAH